MKYIERGWDSYRRLVVPRDASETQIKETRQAFYAGASILFQSLMLTLDPGETETDADMQRMADLQAEIDEFGQQLDIKMFKTAEH